MFRTFGILLLAALASIAISPAGEAPKAPEPPKGLNLSAEEKAKLLEAETPAQKKLRADLAELAKQGQERIWYNSNFDKKQQIYAVNPDGSGLARVMPEGWADDAEYPHLSPDGKKLVFTTKRKMSREEALKLPADPKFRVDGDAGKRRSIPANGTLWIMSPEGKDPHPVALGNLAHWSADGKYLAYGVMPFPNQRRCGLLDVEAGKEWIFSGAAVRAPTTGNFRFTPDGRYYVVGAYGIGLFDMKEIMAGNETPPLGAKAGGIGCNHEISRDGKWLVHCVDRKDGAFLAYFPFDPEKREPSKPVELGWPKETSASYFPDFSPDAKYLVYVHWTTPGSNWYQESVQGDLYVSRWPADGVNVRITWHGGFTQNPQWWGPTAK